MMLYGWSVPDGCPYFVPAIKTTSGKPDEATITAAVGYTRDQRCAIDVGAHIGTWTRPLAERFRRVLAFEPNPTMQEHLCRNVGGLDNVATYGLAVGEKAQSCALHRFGPNSGQTCVSFGEAGESVMVSLDSLGLSEVDLLKIDAEGYELRVLEGTQKIIERDRPVVVIEENVCSRMFDIPRTAAADWLRSRGAREVYREEYVRDNFDVVFAWE